MDGKISSTGASSSSTKKQPDGKRRRRGGAGEHSKKPRHSKPSHGAAQHGFAAVDQSAASNAVAMPLPMFGINGVAPLQWSAASSSAAAAMALPVVAGSGSGGVASMVPGQPVPMPVQLVCFVGMPTAAVNGGGAAPSASMPLAAALSRFPNATLERMMTKLMLECTPPLRTQDRKSGGAKPAWWPTAKEPWWGPEVAAHLPGRKPAMEIPVPFTTPHHLKKAEKVAVLVAAVKHIAPDFARIAAAASGTRMSEFEAFLWNSALHGECARYMTPATAFILPPPPQQQQQQQPLPPSHSAESMAHAVSERDEQPAYFSDSVSGDGEDHAAVVSKPAAEEQHGNDNAGGAAAAEGEKKPEDSGKIHGEQVAGSSGEVAGEAPENFDWFDCDEVRRRMGELDIPDFFGGYYL